MLMFNTLYSQSPSPNNTSDLSRLRLYNLSLRSPAKVHHTSNFYVSGAPGASFNYDREGSGWIANTRGKVGIIIELDEENHSYVDFFYRIGGNADAGTLNEIGGKLMWSWTNIGFKNEKIWGRFGPYGSWTLSDKGDEGFASTNFNFGGEMSFHLSEFIDIAIVGEKKLDIFAGADVFEGDYLMELEIKFNLSSVWKK